MASSEPGTRALLKKRWKGIVSCPPPLLRHLWEAPSGGLGTRPECGLPPHSSWQAEAPGLPSSGGWILSPRLPGRKGITFIITHYLCSGLFGTFISQCVTSNLKVWEWNPNGKHASRAGGRRVLHGLILTSSDLILKRLLVWVIPLGSLLPFKYSNN